MRSAPRSRACGSTPTKHRGSPSSHRSAPRRIRRATGNNQSAGAKGEGQQRTHQHCDAYAEDIVDHDVRALAGDDHREVDNVELTLATICISQKKARPQGQITNHLLNLRAGLCKMVLRTGADLLADQWVLELCDGSPGFDLDDALHEDEDQWRRREVKHAAYHG